MPFHVFLSHSSADKPAVEELARRLAKEGIQAWLDKWHLIPGNPWQPDIEKALAGSETCAVFMGPSGFGPWQNEEMRAAIDQRVRDSGRRFRVIPVLLPGAKRAERSSLPTFLAATTWVEFPNSLDDPAAFHRLVCGIRGREPGAEPGQALYEGQCPYRGLRVFDVDDAPFFFGREALVQWLLNELRPATEGQPVNRFLAIVGASGSGKSSVARAGLVAALKHDPIPGSARWPVAICRPGPDPLESLAVALSRAVNVCQGVPALAELIAEFQKNEKTLHLIVRQSLPENAPDMRLVVVVDQFEEAFTLCREDELREALFCNLLYAAKVVQGQTLVILTMRADFCGKCAANAELAAAFSDHHVLVGPMTEEELRWAIERPTQLVGYELEAGLVDLFVHEVRRQPGVLPLLQHALLELWNKREGRRLTVKAYQEIGKLEGALQRRADATLEAFSKDEQEFCRRMFLRLTQPGEGTEDTKRRATMQELLSLSGESTAEEEIVQKLANASLLTIKGDLIHGDVFVEVAHEALIWGWPQLRTWIDADRAGLRTRTRLTEAAREWKNSGRDPAYFYTGARLAVAKEWEASHPGQLSTDEAEFLAGSLDAQSEREANELEAARKLAEALRERAEEAEKREQEEKVSRELRERLAEEETERQKRELETARKLAEAQRERAEEAEKREREEKARSERRAAFDKQQAAYRYGIPITLTGAFLLWLLVFGNPLEILELRWLGQLLRWRAAAGIAPAVDPHVVHLDIDPHEFESFSTVALKCQNAADIIQEAAGLGAKVVVFNTIFAAGTKDESKPILDAINAAEREGTQVVQAEALEPKPGEYQSMDLIRSFTFSETLGQPAGLINVRLDSDDILRHYALVVQGPHVLEPSLALAAYLSWRGLTWKDVSVLDKAIVRWPELSRDFVSIVTRELQVEPVLLNFRTDWNFRTNDASTAKSVFVHYRLNQLDREYAEAREARNANRPVKKTLDDCVMTVSYIGTGVGDFWRTPMGTNQPGVVSHLQALNDLIQDSFLQRISRLTDAFLLLCVLSFVFFSNRCAGVRSLVIIWVVGVLLIFSLDAWLVFARNTVFGAIYFAGLWTAVNVAEVARRYATGFIIRHYN